MVNNINSPAYTLAEFLRNSPGDILNLPNAYNAPNWTALANNLSNSSTKKNKD